MNVNIKSDKELVSLLIRGEESAFCDLYVRYKDRLFHYCPLKIASRSLKLLEYSLLQEILIRNDLKS